MSKKGASHEMIFDTITSNIRGKIRQETLQGVDYLVAPLTMIVPGVLRGSRGPLYYPLSQIKQNSADWNNVPIVLSHPSNNGQFLSARSPDILDKQGLGYVFNSRVKGKLVAEGWFNVKQTSLVAPQILSNLRSGIPIELSTGLFHDTISRSGTFNNQRFDAIATNYKPDHLAVFTDEVGACSLKDGCGVLVNAKKKTSKKAGGWRTTDDGAKVFIDGAGSVKAGGPAGKVVGGKSATKTTGTKLPIKKKASTSASDRKSQKKGFKDAADESRFEEADASYRHERGIKSGKKSAKKKSTAPKRGIQRHPKYDAASYKKMRGEGKSNSEIAEIWDGKKAWTPKKRADVLKTKTGTKNMKKKQTNNAGNCGIGSGGFQKGNKCAGGGGGAKKASGSGSSTKLSSKDVKVGTSVTIEGLSGFKGTISHVYDGVSGGPKPNKDGRLIEVDLGSRGKANFREKKLQKEKAATPKKKGTSNSRQCAAVRAVLRTGKSG